ncbi:MAG: ATP-binding protein [Defluviitaleaceae bacterium]|nr:ATP-binding protein [Defluviitaleaceae bacterium]
MSIKTKFIVVLVVIITIATIAVVAVRAIQMRDQQRALITERLQGNANLAVGIFETVRGYTFRILDIVATMPYVKELLQGDTRVAETLDRRMYSLFYSINPEGDEMYAYANIMVFDSALRLVSVANPDGDVIRLTESQFIHNVLAAYNGHTHVSNAIRDAESGRLHFLFTQPVMIDGVFSGIAAVLSNTEDLGVFLRDPTHDYDSFINIADAQGTIFFSNRAAYIGRHVNDLGVQEAFGRIPINEMFNHTSAITGIDKIAYILVEPKLEWTIICFFDAAAVNSVFRVIVISLLPTLSGIILASILMLVIVARSLQPLRPLAAAAGEVARGNLSVDFETRRNDEISQVSNSFLDIVKALAILRDSFVKAEESMTSGDIHYHLEDARLSGVYDEMLISTNNMIRHMRVLHTEAEEATKSKSSFLATMSHEIRTPMNAILGIAQIQMQNADLPPVYAAELEKIYSSGNNLLGIINDILDMSKIETGKMEINQMEYDVPSLINDAVHLNIVRIGSKPIEFILEIDENLPLRLIGDELRLKQILNNLISNGIKYTENGYVKLTVNHSEEDGDVSLHLLVEDSGQGMTHEDRDLLFSEYIRFNAEANRRTEGTGLGLSITKKLVELMDGTIWAESEYGKGSVFMVMVKQKAVECEPIGAELAEQLCSFKFRGHKQFADLQINYEPMPYGKVLIVDDVETNLYVAKGLMMPYRLEIETVPSGFAAIEKVNEGKRYDIIFMDHMMPQMDGIETTHRLRNMGYKDTIVALTANALAGNDEMFRSEGFDGFISKPIDIRELNNVLNKFVRDKYPEEVRALAQAQSETEDTAVAAGTDAKKADVELLAIFIRDAEKAIPIIRAAKEDDLRPYVVNVHAMKSALANIGEREASAAADILETAGKKRNMETIKSETEPFLERLESIIARIKAELPDEEASAAADSDPQLLHAKLSQIAAACDEYDDIAVEAALSELRQLQWTKETQELLSAIAEHVFHSDFEKAAELIKEEVS